MKIELITPSDPINLGILYPKKEKSLLKLLNGVAEKNDTPVILRGIFEESSAIILLGADEKLPVISVDLVESFKKRTLRFSPIACKNIVEALRTIPLSFFYSDDDGRIFTIVAMSKRSL